MSSTGITTEAEMPERGDGETLREFVTRIGRRSSLEEGELEALTAAFERQSFGPEPTFSGEELLLFRRFVESVTEGTAGDGESGDRPTERNRSGDRGPERSREERAPKSVAGRDRATADGAPAERVDAGSDEADGSASVDNSDSADASVYTHRAGQFEEGDVAGVRDRMTRGARRAVDRLHGAVGDPNPDPEVTVVDVPELRRRIEAALDAGGVADVERIIVDIRADASVRLPPADTVRVVRNAIDEVLEGREGVVLEAEGSQREELVGCNPTSVRLRTARGDLLTSPPEGPEGADAGKSGRCGIDVIDPPTDGDRGSPSPSSTPGADDGVTPAED